MRDELMDAYAEGRKDRREEDEAEIARLRKSAQEMALQYLTLYGQAMELEAECQRLRKDAERWRAAATAASQELCHCAPWSAGGQAFAALRALIDGPNVRVQPATPATEA